jgi:hypothetical protein
MELRYRNNILLKNKRADTQEISKQDYVETLRHNSKLTVLLSLSYVSKTPRVAEWCQCDVTDHSPYLSTLSAEKDCAFWHKIT